MVVTARAAWAVATLGAVGRAPLMPATLASVLAVAGAWALHRVGSFPLLLFSTAALVLLGLWAVQAAGAADRRNGRMVIDSVAGQWVALWPLSGGLWWMGAEPHVFPWPGWVGGFLLFRVLDALKPGPIGQAHRRGGTGAILDDLLSGALAALVIAVSAAVAHGAFR